MDVPVRDVPLGQWTQALQQSHDEGYSFFDWLSAVDQTDAAEHAGFDVVCHLIDPTSRGDLRRVLLRARVPHGSALPSATAIWAGAAWHERETHEMFGIDISGFDDGTGLGLRPLLLPDGFEGAPLRKEFVLAARASKPWPGAKEPGEDSETHKPGRRRLTPPGVPDPGWGPR